MSFDCIDSRGTSVLENCIPECSRWSQVNEGNPIRVYHDIDGVTDFPTHPDTIAWDGDFYSVLSGIDPQQFLDSVIRDYNDCYACGDLLVMVDDPDQADMVWLYQYTDQVSGDSIDVAGAAVSTDTDAEGCSLNIDNTLQSGPGNPAWMEFNFYTPSAPLTPDDFMPSLTYFYYIWLHEMGHMIGMGHAFNLTDTNGNPIYSVMGDGPNNMFPQDGLTEWDKERIAIRYPCDCNLVIP